MCPARSVDAWIGALAVGLFAANRPNSHRRFPNARTFEGIWLDPNPDAPDNAAIMIKYEPKSMPPVEEVEQKVREKFTEHKVVLAKNPVAGYFVLVRKSPFTGAAVWVNPKKGTLRVNSCIPAWWVRAFFLGLILLPFIYSSGKRIEKEVGEFVQATFP